MSSVRRSNEDFLDALEALILSEGFRHLTIGMLARRLRCSRRRLYHLAPTKEALILFVIERVFRTLRTASLIEASKHRDPGAKIEAYLSVGQDYLRRGHNQVMADIEAWPETQALFDRHLRDCVHSLAAIIEEGQRTGQFTACSSVIAAEMLYGAARRFRDPAFLHGAGLSFDQAIGALSHLVRFGLVVR